jgi:hypothetical protein
MQNVWLSCGRIGCLASLFIALGCVSQPLVEETAADSPRLASRTLYCYDSGGVDAGAGDHAWYAVDSMTRKLRRFPALAGFVGLSEVSSCEDAIVYARAYDQFALQNPGFDVAASATNTEMAESNERHILPRLKIIGGNSDKLHSFPGKPSPIVRLLPVSWLANDKQAQFTNAAGKLINQFCDPIVICSGTFISKYWILTAGHCLQHTEKLSVGANPRLPPPAPYPYCVNGDGGQPVSVGVKPLAGTADYIIQWSSDTSDPFSKELTSPLGVHVRQVPFPTYGTTGVPITQDRDLALLYLDPWNHIDGLLPPDTDHGQIASIKASPSAPVGSDGFYVAGYGVTPADPDNLLLMETAATNDITWSGPWARAGIPTTGWNGKGPCVGDSGGPLFRKTLQQAPYPLRVVTYGVTSALYHGDPSKPKFQGCTAVGDTVTWGRLEGDPEVINWINKTKAKYGEGPCREADEKEDIGMTYRCWGKPCGGTQNLTCDSGWRCVGAGASIRPSDTCDMRLCPQATNPNALCECVIGQCMPVSK